MRRETNAVEWTSRASATPANGLVGVRAGSDLSSAGSLSLPRGISSTMIRKLKSGEYRLYSRKRDASGKRRNLGTFSSREKAEQHERAIQFFKRH
jgi:hypothetical protein